MKTAFVFLACIIMTAFPGWLTNFDKAKAVALQTHRCILLNFSGSDWCIPCIQLKKNIFDTKDFMEFADSSLVLLNADFPRGTTKMSKEQLQHNEMQAEKYNPAGKFPFTLLLDAEGKILARWEDLGKTNAADFITQIQKLK